MELFIHGRYDPEYGRQSYNLGLAKPALCKLILMITMSDTMY